VEDGVYGSAAEGAVIFDGHIEARDEMMSSTQATPENILAIANEVPNQERPNETSEIAERIDEAHPRTNCLFVQEQRRQCPENSHIRQHEALCQNSE
jgi:hypothetical protein